MAWREGDGGRQFRKDGSAAKRPQLKLAALTDAQDTPTKPRKRARAKPFGLKFFWLSSIQGRETHFTQWYETERAQAQARTDAEREMTGPRLRYTRIENAER